MDVASQLRELARNLYWTWQPDVLSIFRSLDPALWRQVNHNPVEFLVQIPTDELHKKAVDQALEARISFAFHRLHDYLGDEHTWGSMNAGPLRSKPVAYFSAEFGLHESLPIYSGGLGVLAGDHLKSASDLGVPLVGVGLFYAQGYFNQRITGDGWQQEHYFAADVEKLPLAHACNEKGQPLRIRVETRSSTIQVGIWTVRVGRNQLVLLDSDVDGNTVQDRQLTASLYGGDQEVRIRQELILGVGGLRALQAMGITPGVLHMNEGHSAFAVLEAARVLMARDARSFRDVEEKVAGMTVFTTHTPVDAGHDRFAPALIEEVLGPLRERLGLTQGELLALGRVQPGDQNEAFCMTVLGLKMSRRANAVSALHGHVSRAMWRGLWGGVPQHSVPIGHVTNGVHVSSWLAPDMARLFTRYLRQGWYERLCYRETWDPIGQIPDVELWEAHEIQKARLVNYMKRAVGRALVNAGNGRDVMAAIERRLDPSVLTIGFARRFAGYKRADLLLWDMDQLDRLVNDRARPVQIIFAGKAHPHDELAKRLLQRVVQVSRDPRFAGRIIFLEDHDINVGRHLVQGVDLWLNLPRRPLEACGTSGQKVVLNGGLNMSVLDGWWAEAYSADNGFAVGDGGEHSDADRQDRLDRDAAYELLLNRVVPLFYARDEHGVPTGWVRIQKAAMQTLAWRFNADRMLMDYTRDCYLPAANGLSSCAMH